MVSIGLKLKKLSQKYKSKTSKFQRGENIIIKKLNQNFQVLAKT